MIRLNFILGKHYIHLEFFARSTRKRMESVFIGGLLRRVLIISVHHFFHFISNIFCIAFNSPEQKNLHGNIPFYQISDFSVVERKESFFRTKVLFLMENELQVLLDEFIELEEGLNRLRSIFKKIVIRLQTALGVPVESAETESPPAGVSEARTPATGNVDLSPVYEEMRKLAIAIKAVDDKVNGLMKGGIQTNQEVSPALKNEVLAAIDIIKKWSKEMDALKHETSVLLSKFKEVLGQ